MGFNYTSHRKKNMGMETLHLHRIFNAPIERVYRAFTEAEALTKWLPPNGYTAKITHFEPVADGAYEIILNNFITDEKYIFKGKYLELIPYKLIRYTDQLCDENGEVSGSITEKTIQFEASFMGTEVTIQQTGLLERQLKEACYLDWQQSLSLLALLATNEH